MINVKKMIERYYSSHFSVYPRCEGCGSEIRESDAAEGHESVYAEDVIIFEMSKMQR